MREPEKQVFGQSAAALPMIDDFVADRSVYSRMGSGMLGRVRDKKYKAVAVHAQDALNEMTDLLDALDAIIKETK